MRQRWPIVAITAVGGHGQWCIPSIRRVGKPSCPHVPVRLRSSIVSQRSSSASSPSSKANLRSAGPRRERRLAVRAQRAAGEVVRVRAEVGDLGEASDTMAQSLRCLRFGAAQRFPAYLAILRHLRSGSTWRSVAAPTPFHSSAVPVGRGRTQHSTGGGDTVKALNESGVRNERKVMHGE